MLTLITNIHNLHIVWLKSYYIII
uniref:Uncharacterized protein n=1 Tax=Rhizophora mucronata TaxID=61149 RepID=A0A2P2N5I2_RHIMU